MRRRRTLESYGILVALALVVGAPVWFYIDGIRSSEPLSWRHPWALMLVWAAPLLAWVGFHLRTSRAGVLRFSRVVDLGATRPGLVSRAMSLPAALRVVTVTLLAIALAGPMTFRTEVLKVQGIDIMIVLDLSKSMEETDLSPNRLDAGRRTIRTFISKRAHDRIGLVVFAEEAMMQCPLTLDYRSLDEIVSGVRIGDVPPMGTAIGDALGLALASLRRSENTSKVVILVSDGDSNVANVMGPREAKEVALDMGVTVFTILMGQEQGERAGLGRKRYGVNPALLIEIAKDTGGDYFNAGDDAALSKSFDEIRQALKKREQRIVGRTPDRELFGFFLWPALCLLGLEILLRLTRWRRFP